MNVLKMPFCKMGPFVLLIPSRYCLEGINGSGTCNSLSPFITNMHVNTYSNSSILDEELFANNVNEHTFVPNALCYLTMFVFMQYTLVILHIRLIHYCVI